MPSNEKLTTQEIKTLIVVKKHLIYFDPDKVYKAIHTLHILYYIYYNEN